MNPPSDLVGEDRSIWLARETLADRLSQSPDIDSAYQTSLQFILDTAERSTGALIIVIPGESTLHFAAKSNLDDQWVVEIQDPESTIAQLVRGVIETGQVFSPQRSSAIWPAPEQVAAALPISWDGNSLGAVLILGANCSPERIDQLASLLPPVARVIQTERGIQAFQERTRDLARLQSDLTRMGFHTDFENLQARIIQGACQVLAGSSGALALLDSSDAEWMVRKALDEDGEWVYQISPKEGKGLVRACLNSGATIRVDDVSTDRRFDPSSDAIGDDPVQTMICAPLHVDGEVLGAIQVINKRQGVFTNLDQDMLSMITSLAANAMNSTRLIQQLKIVNADLEASRWELLESRNMLRALFDNLPTGLYIIDPQYKIMLVNRSRALLTGKSSDSLIDKTCYQALFDRTSPCPECRVQDTFQDGASTQRSESRLGDGDETTEFEISTYPIDDGAGQIVQAILLEQDVTERYRLEGILAQSEKLAAIGQLAAGVAHEINNPLTAIIANAQILHRELPPESDLQESIDLIARAGARATQVVRNLLDFARKEDYHLGLTDINETLRRALELLQHEVISRGVIIEFKPDPSLPPILASHDHLQSVWLNLILNAVDSLDKTPGKIKVSAQRISDEIHVSVADNGKGIAPERLTRIFEPFYTTKEPGRGTGLGLSVCHRIIKQHGGQIRVESQIGVGSEFTISLPLS